MNYEKQLELAAQIYALKVVLQPDWDLQKHARESFRMATQFFLAVQAEQAGSSSSSHWSILDSIVEQGKSSSSPHPQPGSTTNTPKQSAKDSTAGAKSGSETEAPAHTGSHQEQSQEQPTLGIEQVPFAPYDPDT